MLQSTFPHDHPQDEFTYTDEAWKPIRAILDELDRDADMLTIAQKTMGGEPRRDTLREALESEAQLYRMRAQVLPHLTAAKIRKGLKTAQNHAAGAHAHIESITRSRSLWFQYMSSTMDGVELHVKLEEIALPLLSEIQEYLTRQIEALRPHQNPSAAKPAQDRYFEALIDIWDKVAAGDDADANRPLRVKFIRAAAAPVMGADIATSDVVRRWLNRNENRNA